MLVTLLLSIIFMVLAIVHFSWAFGSSLGFQSTIPTKPNGEKLFLPRRFDCIFVGLVLFLFGLFYLIMSGLVTYSLPDNLIKYGGWIIPSIFILRAVGEFKYVGFFKRISNTTFGKLDTKFYAPLSLIIGAIGILIKLKLF